MLRANARGWRVTYSTVRSPYTSCVVMYRLSFGETRPNRGTPNYQGSHQKSSCGGPRGRIPHPSQRRTRVSPSRSSYHEPSARIHIRASERLRVHRANSGSTRATTRRRLPVPSEHPHSYKGVGTDRVRLRTRVASGGDPATFAFHSMGGEYLTPSNHLAPVMRFHACNSHKGQCEQLLETHLSLGRRTVGHLTLAV